MTTLRVDEFVEQALYDTSTGFYETGGRAGRRGASFLTSPEVGPLFGAVVARAIDAWWRSAGRPADWVVVDAGAGPGSLARSIRAAEPECGGVLRLISVERSASQRALHPDGTKSAAALPAEADIVVANELLDNLPFGILERTLEGWSEVYVTDHGGTTPDTGGARVPVAAAAAAWVSSARSRLRPGGRLICLDYADTTPMLASRPWNAWVRAFAGHEQVDDPFADAGSRDVTVVVPWDQLPRPDHVTDQATWLRTHGIEELVEQGRSYWEAHAAAPDLRAMRMRSRLAEVSELVDPDGLGGFWVGEWRA